MSKKVTEARVPVEAKAFLDSLKDSLKEEELKRIEWLPNALSATGGCLSKKSLWTKVVETLSKILNNETPGTWLKKLHNKWWEFHLTGEVYLVYWLRKNGNVAIGYLGTSSELKRLMNDLEPLEK